jgi:hypothetical protein
MAFIKLRLAAVSVSVLIAVSGCAGTGDPGNSAQTGNTAAPAQNQSKASTSAEELGLLINFTLEPEDLVWREDKAKNSIVAVLRMDVEDTKKLADQFSQRAPGIPKTVQVEDWFPPELIAKGEIAGGSSVEGAAFPADDFYQDPYSLGTVTRVAGTDFFVVELSGK